MTRFPLLFAIFMAAFLQNCKQEQAQNTQKEEKEMSKEETMLGFSVKPFVFSEAKDIKSLKETEIVPTLENDCSPDKNSIYSTSILLAWQELKKALKSEIIATNSNSNDFQLLTKSKSYKNGLTERDVKNEVTIGDGIEIKTSFKKELPFSFAFQDLQTPFLFLGKKVAAFGLCQFLHDPATTVHIYYYGDDNHFVMGINPDDDKHEIIFAKGIDLKGSHIATYQKMQKWIEIGAEEQKEENNKWKYRFIPHDTLIIPKIDFHIQNDYKDLVGQKLGANNQIITLANQDIAFHLDEKGVAVEDIARFTTKGIFKLQKPKPKRLILDQPFFFILRKKGNENPYFAMKIRNAELMVKQ